MKITSDWHIHSEHSCDDACLPIADLVKESVERGILDLGVTDHIHTFYNLPDIAASRKAYLATNHSVHFHFGVEAGCQSQWEIDEIKAGRCANPIYGIREGGPAWGQLALGLTEEDIAEYSIEYVVAGTHWPMYAPFNREDIIRDYHRQNMFLMEHPLVNIVAHPWWWMGHWADENGCFNAEPWFDDFGVIPTSMHDEFAAASIQLGKVIEINLEAMLLSPVYPENFKQQYAEYLAYLKSRRVKLSIGSDCHNRHYDINFEKAGEMLEAVGINDEELWRLPPVITVE